MSRKREKRRKRGKRGTRCAAACLASRPIVASSYLRAAQTQNLNARHLVLNQRIFLWESYIICAGTRHIRVDEVWWLAITCWPTDLVNTAKQLTDINERVPECRINSTCT
jgi:hypothetical protein